MGASMVRRLVAKGLPSAALFDRFSSRGHAGFANQLLSATRHEFGGHVEKKACAPSRPH